MDVEPQVLNNFINCCTCAREEAMDFNNVALLLLTDDTPVFIELIILMIPSRTPPFPVEEEDVPVLVLVVPVDAPVVVVVVVAAGTVLVVDDSLLLLLLLFIVDICDAGCCGGTGCDKALPNAGIGADGNGVTFGAGCDANNGGCKGGGICCCCICCHC